MPYATYSRGAKSGGLNLTVLPVGVAAQVRPEKVDNYELGLKSQFFDRRLTVNAAAFWTNVRDYQTLIVDYQSTTYSVQYVANIPKVRSRGFEGDIAFAPTKHISLSGSFAYTDAVYQSYKNSPAPVEQNPTLPNGAINDLSGRPLAGVPKFAFSLAGDVDQPIGDDYALYAHVDYAHRSSFYTTTQDSVYSIVKPYGLTNARIGVRTEDGKWDLSVWARNLFNVDYFVTLSPLNTGLITGLTGDPRTFGVTLRTSL